MKEVKKMQKLEEYLKKAKKQEIEDLYEKLRIREDEIDSYEEKIEMIYSQLLFNAMTMMILNNEDYKVIMDIASGVKVREVEDLLIDNYMVIKKNNGYETFEEIVDIYEKSISKEGITSRKQIFIGAYLEYNGVLEVDKLIELMKESGFEINKRELNSILKKGDYKKVGNLVYLNEQAENLNIDNVLLNIKNNCEFGYKTINNMQELLTDQISCHELANSIVEIISQKVEDVDLCNEIVYLIYYCVLAGDNYHDEIEKILEFREIKLSKKLKNKLYELIDDVFFVLPSWSTNGFSPIEMSCYLNSFLDDKYDDNFDKDLVDYYDDFDILSTPEKLEVYINAYMQINGAIKLDKLVEIITVNHRLEVSHDDIVASIKSSNNIKILNDYVTLNEVNEEDLKLLLNAKKMNRHYIIDNIDNHFNNVEELEENINNVIYCYKLNQDVLDGVMAVLNMGIFNEEMLNIILEDNGFSLLNKKVHQLYNDLKGYVNRYPVWYLNGFSLYEMNSVKNANKKVGRNELCPCGSGKKYKKCCGK